MMLTKMEQRLSTLQLKVSFLQLILHVNNNSMFSKRKFNSVIFQVTIRVMLSIGPLFLVFLFDLDSYNYDFNL